MSAHSSTPAPGSLTYDQAGVKYDQVDPIKLLAQQSAKATVAILRQGLAGSHCVAR